MNNFSSATICIGATPLKKRVSKARAPSKTTPYPKQARSILTLHTSISTRLRHWQKGPGCGNAYLLSVTPEQMVAGNYRWIWRWSVLKIVEPARPADTETGATKTRAGINNKWTISYFLKPRRPLRSSGLVYFFRYEYYFIPTIAGFQFQYTITDWTIIIR